MALNAGTRLGPYEILAPAGAGGMGEVYRARDTRLDRLVAVKVLPDAASPMALERFEREARAIAALSHPGICAIYDVGTSPVPFLVMELLDGETLHARLQRGPLDLQALIEVSLALADALATAHAKGIVHRDLKPANIFVTAHGPKILDFGLARVADVEASVDVGATAYSTLAAQAPLTDAGVAVGTVAYMSPEQLRGEALDQRTDLFSLGLVLYEMATGRRAFGGSTNAVTSASILHEQPVAPRERRPDIPPRLEQTLLTLLEKDRDVRTQTASELRADLTRLKRELTRVRAPEAPTRGTAASDYPPPPTKVRTAPPSSSDAQLIAGVVRRHRGAVGIAAALLLVTAVVVGYRASSGTPSPPAQDAVSLSIADLQVERLTTSGTADTPAISPDGNYVVYVERPGVGSDSLRVRQVATGSNVEIVPPESGTALRGATFTPDGTFVNYVRQNPPQPFELWQIPLLGGTSRQLVRAGRVAFSPDGNQMAYVRSGTSGRTELVAVGNDGSGERVVASRQLPDRFWPAGGISGFAPAWSPDSTTIAVLGGRDDDSPTGQVVFVDVKSGAERTADAGPPLLGTGLAWLSADVLIASAVDRTTAPFQLWLVSRADGLFRRLTNDTNQYLGISLTADRNALVTARAESSFGVWTSDASAKTWHQTVPTKAVKDSVTFGLRWSGKDLLYVSSARGGFALTRFRVSSQSEDILAQGGGSPSVSRDGSKILFFDYDQRELSTIDSGGLNRAPIQRGLGVLEPAHATPDGKQYVTIEARPGKAPAVTLVALDGTGKSTMVTADRVRVAASLLGSGRVEVSPDGQLVAYPSFAEGNRAVIAVCDLATCSSRRELSTPGARWRWMPDSRALAYVAGSDLWVQPLDGSAPRQLTQFVPDGQIIWDFDWSADGRRLAVARGKTSTDIVLFRGLRGKK